MRHKKIVIICDEPSYHRVMKLCGEILQAQPFALVAEVQDDEQTKEASSLEPRQATTQVYTEGRGGAATEGEGAEAAAKIGWGPGYIRIPVESPPGAKSRTTFSGALASSINEAGGQEEG